MIISKEHQFVFIDIPKTASLTLDTIFTRHCGGRQQRPPSVSGVGGKHCRVIPDFAKNYTRITCVRNPIDRMLSYYYFHVKRGVELQKMKISTLDEFIDYSLDRTLNCADDDPVAWNYRYFPCWKYLKPTGYDIVLRQENLPQDLAQLSFLPPDISLPEKNVNPHSQWAEVTTAQRLEKIITWAGDDFEMFGYQIPSE